MRLVRFLYVFVYVACRVLRRFSGWGFEREFVCVFGLGFVGRLVGIY